MQGLGAQPTTNGAQGQCPWQRVWEAEPPWRNKIKNEVLVIENAYGLRHKFGEQSAQSTTFQENGKCKERISTFLFNTIQTTDWIFQKYLRKNALISFPELSLHSFTRIETSPNIFWLSPVHSVQETSDNINELILNLVGYICRSYLPPSCY